MRKREEEEDEPPYEPKLATLLYLTKCEPLSHASFSLEKRKVRIFNSSVVH
jgi:hypothetical protein